MTKLEETTVRLIDLLQLAADHIRDGKYAYACAVLKVALDYCEAADKALAALNRAKSYLPPPKGKE